jgi:hypothetical protein
MASVEPPPGALTGHRRHRRIAYRCAFGEPLAHTGAPYLVEGIYRDREGKRIGPVFTNEDPPEEFLVLPDEEIPLVHVEAALDADHRVASYEQVVGLLFDPQERVPRGVDENGERWDNGELVVYTFESDEEALEAQY